MKEERVILSWWTVALEKKNTSGGHRRLRWQYPHKSVDVNLMYELGVGLKEKRSTNLHQFFLVMVN